MRIMQLAPVTGRRYFSAAFAGTPLYAVPLVLVCLSDVLRLAGSSTPHSS